MKHGYNVRTVAKEFKNFEVEISPSSKWNSSYEKVILRGEVSPFFYSSHTVTPMHEAVLLQMASYLAMIAANSKEIAPLRCASVEMEQAASMRQPVYKVRG